MTVEEFLSGSKSVILTLFHEGIMWLLKLNLNFVFELISAWEHLIHQTCFFNSIAGL